MIYELRIYRPAPGKLAALNKRFETITLKFWDQYGIRPVGFWTTTIGDNNNDLYYLLAWESLAEREQKWSAFQRDPEWSQARAQTEAENGGAPLTTVISNMILTPTSYSKLK